MTFTTPCRRKYLRVIITMVMTVGIMGYAISSGSQSLTGLYSGVVTETRDMTGPSIPSKLRLLSYKGMLANQSETSLVKSLVNNQSSSNVSSVTHKVPASPGLISRLGSTVLKVPVEALPPKVLIPHIIHQTWDSDTVPSYFSKWIKSWTKLHPDWEYWFWTPKEVKRLIHIVNPAFLKEYNGYKLNLYRANSMRYYIMFYFGGVYADLDLEALKPLDNWTYGHHCILPEETYAHPYLLHKMRRANTMITLLACRAHHPYFQVTMDNLKIYPRLKSGEKILYVDNMYLKYNKTTLAHARPENEIYLAHPKYFLPTYDPGWTSKFKGMCSSTYHRSKMLRQHREVCDELRAENFRNQPKPESFTNHHWTHVVTKTETWKRRNTIKISDIVPNVKDINKVLDKLEQEMKELQEKNKKLKENEEKKTS